MGRFIATDGTATIGDKYPNRVVYDTPGTYTFTVPDNVKTIKTTVIGGGGNGYEGFKYVKSEDKNYDQYLNDIEPYVCSANPDTNTCYVQCCQKGCYPACTCARWSSDSQFLAGGLCADLNICSNAYCMCIVMCNMGTNPRYNRQYLGLVAFGGGSGGYAHKEIKVTPGSSHTVTVGDSEGTSSFGSEVSATGAKTEINRCYSAVGMFYDGGTAADHSSSSPCLCSARTDSYIRACWEANTTNPQFYPVGSTTSHWESANSFCVLEYLSRNICFVENYLNTDCAICSTPGQGIGGDVNKTGDTGTLVEYDIIPSHKDRDDGTFNTTVCRFVCGPTENRMGNTNVDKTMFVNARSCHYISSSYTLAYSDCTCNSCGTNCGASLCTAVPVVFYDSKIKGSVPGTEYTQAEGYGYDCSFTTHQVTPYMCREDFNPIERFSLIRQGYSDGVGPSTNGAGVPFSYHTTYQVWSPHASSSCEQKQPFDARVEQVFRPLNEDSYIDYLMEYQRFTPLYALNEMMYCCDGYSFEERLKTSDMNYRLNHIQTFCTSCYDSSAPHGSNTTYIHCDVDGSKRLIPSCISAYDHCGIMATGSAPCINNCYDASTTVGTLINTLQVANTADEAWDIIDNTIKHYEGDYSKVWHENTYTQVMCRKDGCDASTRGFSCDCHSYADRLSYLECSRKVGFGYQDTSTNSKTGLNISNNQYTGATSSVTYASISGACYECAGGGIPGVRMFSHSQAHASIPYIDPEDKFIGLGNCGHGSTYDTTFTTFYKTRHNISDEPSITESCMKTHYKNAGTGGDSSWYKDKSKGRPGLVVVCY
jgi:hypothetical protein